ncbi:MAG TPA: 4Fe-4S dicluster domain-containing protein [Candidatus Krumholzibacteria bacterium]|nr:4Fe-4S dicluster domain-containing protein [Candidatus Krumholzibacteria bacterium]
MDRRDFLRWVGVASGASVLAGCDLNRKSEKLIPYLVPPDDGTIPGEATFLATSCTECPANCGVTARVRDARPVKLEGLAGHPVNDGALCIRGQASLNRLYNVERIRGPQMKDASGKLAPTTWDNALPRVASAIKSGGDHALLSGRTSGSLAALMEDFSSRTGVRRLPEFEVFSYAAVREANRELFGQPVVPVAMPDAADVVITVGADVLETCGNPVAFARALARRRDRGGKFEWYHVEPHASMTGFKASQRVVVRPGTEAHLLAFLLHAVAGQRSLDSRTAAHVNRVPAVTADRAAEVTGIAREQIEHMSEALVNASNPLLLAGGVSVAHDGGLDVAHLAALLQSACGMNGRTLDFAAGADYSRTGSMADFDRLVQRLEAGQVGTLILFNVDPVGLVADDRLKNALSRAALLVGVGDMPNPTLDLCDIVLPLSHTLESWGDNEPAAGVLNVVQPALTPLFDTLSAGDILLRIMAEAGAAQDVTYQQYVADRWAREYGTGAEEMVKTGFVSRKPAAAAITLRDPDHRFTFDTTGGLEGGVLVLAPSVRWYDGRSEGLELLREIPDPLTSVSWDAWVSVGMETATALGVADQDEVEIRAAAWTTRLPVRRQPGLARDVFVVQRGAAAPPTGWSRVSGESGAYLAGVSVTPTGRRVRLPILSGSLGEEGRGIVPGHHPEHFSPHAEMMAVHGGAHSGEVTGHPDPKDTSFYPAPDYPKYRWAMAIDMEKCVGCSACVAACHVENNVPMTGREEHLKGREMSWIRLEQYYSEDGSQADFVPTMCQHCDYATCEPVCPVYATYHNNEGLNAQVYNRCVGTRYCSNNCPYKQRRFNWFAHNDRPHPLNLMVNPDVSLRGKGIMEKCTMCVQRIRKARDVAKDEKRDIREGDLTTACAQSCPGNAIVFGNLLDENSEVHKWAHSERSTRILEELGTSPGVFYLKKGNGHDA